MTKVVGTASGIFKEMAAGKISLKDRVGDFFPAACSAVTVRDLLLHTSACRRTWMMSGNNKARGKSGRRF